MIKSTEVGNFRPIFVFGDEDFDLSSKVVIQGLGTGNILRLDDYSGDTKAVFTNAGNVGIGITNPQRTLHIKDVLRLEPQASAPSGGLGDLYVGTDGKLYFHNGAAWKEVSLK